jgi:hypothetical protein
VQARLDTCVQTNLRQLNTVGSVGDDALWGKIREEDGVMARDWSQIIWMTFTFGFEEQLVN